MPRSIKSTTSRSSAPKKKPASKKVPQIKKVKVIKTSATKPTAKPRIDAIVKKEDSKKNQITKIKVSQVKPVKTIKKPDREVVLESIAKNSSRNKNVADNTTPEIKIISDNKNKVEKPITREEKEKTAKNFTDSIQHSLKDVYTQEEDNDDKIQDKEVLSDSFSSDVEPITIAKKEQEINPNAINQFIPNQEQKKVTFGAPNKGFNSGQSNLTESEQDDKAHSKNVSLGLYRKIALSFISLAVLLLLVIFYVAFINVTIVLVPKQERLSSNLFIDVFDQDKKTAVSEQNILGAVKQVEVEQTKAYPAGGIEIITEEVVGKVTLINNYNKNQPLVATTRLLSSDDKLFRIRKTVNVPAGGQIEVEVYADESSQDMVIGPTHFTIPGLWAALQDKIYGENKEPMEYSNQTKSHIQQTDIDEAIKDLKQVLLGKAQTEISQNYQDYSQVIYELDENSISQNINAKVGDEQEEFTVEAKTMITVVAFNENKIFDLAKQKLILVLPDDKELLEFKKEDIKYSLNSYNIDKGSASLNINFAGKMTLKESANIIDREKLMGLNNQQLSAYLDEMPGIDSYEIKFFPPFYKKVPSFSLADRIKIKIKK